MKFTRSKVLIILGFVLLTFFFANDFGLIDIEKTAIITAIGIDVTDDDRFELTLQVAVPEAASTTSENSKAVVSGKGYTVAEAIGNIGSLTGWYQKLSFCNLILVGKTALKYDVNDFLDYFARTIKIQDSALVATVDGSAKEYMQIASPLDNISSFALQKILLKKPGMDSDVLTSTIKEFSIGYFSRTGTSYMPYIVKT
ncbi:MAG: hypothetical protein MJ072_01215, partial [Clostridia bacterium]|nr:hypothetical protein [Clostridia bacterium]